MKSKTPVELTFFLDYSDNTLKNGRHIFKNVVERYGDMISLKFRFCSINPKDIEFQLSAKAALTAEMHGCLYEMNTLLVDHEGRYTESGIFEMVESLGIDLPKFREDFESVEIAKRLENGINETKQSGVNIFPGITINGSWYKGAWDEYALMEAIDDAKSKPVKQAMKNFVDWGASAAIALLLAAIAALIFANIGFSEEYEFLRHFELGLVAGEDTFLLPLEVWINDGLMAIFFLLIGLEIKREVLSGELSDMKKATMPVIGAIGGMLVPAFLYVLINFNGEGAHGWGVPMATDIAFTLGLMALLGSKVPGALKVFISALAVSDDLGAIIVIALFYGHGFHLSAFIASIVVMGVMGILNYKKVYSKTIYIVLGVLLWFFIYQSGLHATLAGVITAILIPSRRKGNLLGIAAQTSAIFEQEITKVRDADNNQESIRHSSLRLIQNAIDRLIGPGEHIEYSLEKTVNYSILPLFAFFNTGILLAGAYFDLFTPINLGIIIGLCIGKPLGIVGFCWLASKLKLASLSREITWFQLISAACLAGVGFTMSIVVGASAFEGETLNGAKLSILIASTISALIGLLLLKKSVSFSKTE